MDSNASVLLDRDIEHFNEIDAIDEIRLRTWARQNYAAAHDRDETWHPIILDEMNRKDSETIAN